MNIDTACHGLLPIVKLIRQGLIPIIQIGIPIILIVLGMLDLGKAVVASKEDEVKKAQQMLIKRAIYAIAIFFVVLIVSVVMNLVATSGESGSNDWATCWCAASASGKC